jgi:hypothetical protein
MEFNKTANTHESEHAVSRGLIPDADVEHTTPNSQLSSARHSSSSIRPRKENIILYECFAINPI